MKWLKDNLVLLIIAGLLGVNVYQQNQIFEEVYSIEINTSVTYDELANVNKKLDESNKFLRWIYETLD